jgi:HEAT repeat protein
MAIQQEEVRKALQAEEPNYARLASEFGVEVLPYLKQMVVGETSLLASKAAYLAATIGTEEALPVLRQAASSSDVSVRLAAASGATNLSGEHASEVLLPLVDDADIGVQKVALRSVPANASDPLVERITAITEIVADPEMLGMAAESDEIDAGMADARRVVAQAAAEAMARVKKK